MQINKVIMHKQQIDEIIKKKSVHIKMDRNRKN